MKMCLQEGGMQQSGAERGPSPEGEHTQRWPEAAAQVLAIFDHG